MTAAARLAQRWGRLQRLLLQRLQMAAKWWRAPQPPHCVRCWYAGLQYAVGRRHLHHRRRYHLEWQLR